MTSTWLKQAAKAFYAAASAALAGLATTLTGDQNLGDLTTLQWVILSGFVLAAFGAVYRLGPHVQPPGGQE